MEVLVSEVETLKGRRVRILLDNGDQYTLLRSSYTERPLQPGDPVDPQEYASWVLLRQYRSALDRAVAMLAVRPCSKGEIEQKLRRTGYSADTVEMVLTKLASNDLLNDQEFAGLWAQYRAGQKYGPRRILQELKQKGVSAEDMSQALEELPEEDLQETAVQLAAKGLRRARAGEDPRKTRQRVLAALVRRGFSWEQARIALEWAGSSPEEDFSDDF